MDLCGEEVRHMCGEMTGCFGSGLDWKILSALDNLGDVIVPLDLVRLPLYCLKISHSNTTLRSLSPIFTVYL